MIGTLILATAFASQCQPAGCWRRGWFHHRPAPVCWSAPPMPMPIPTTVLTTDHTDNTDQTGSVRPSDSSVVKSDPPADPYGFTTWLCSVRAARGLGPVAWDPNLAAWAAQNSLRGFGHFVRAGRHQNAGWGSAAVIWPSWLTSPGHIPTMLDPSITRVGIAVVGSVWTLNSD